jgi:CubicO group peptidase (beta-lactamase class C family)
LALALEAPPGTHYQYSNAGYTLAAALVEIVSGEQFQSYLRNKLFLPAGMTNTGLYGDGIWAKGKLAHNYVGDHDLGAPGEWPANWSIFGAGGVVSSAADLYKWHLAYEHNVVFSEEAKKKIFTPYVQEEPGGMFYAYGWTVSKTPRGTTLIQHNGGHDRGASAFFRRFIDDGVVVIVLSNRFVAPGDFLGIKVARQVSDVIFGEVIPEPPAAVRAGEAELKGYEGEYRTASDGQLRVWLDRNKLLIDGKNQAGLDALSDAPRNELSSYSTLNGRAAAAMQAVCKGDFEEAQQKFGGKLPLERLRGRMGQLLDPGNLGACAKADVLGTVNNEGDPWTYVLVKGDKGSATLKLGWSENGEGVVAVQPTVGDLSPSVMVPTGLRKFASFDFGSRKVTTYLFSKAPPRQQLSIQKAYGSIEASQTSTSVATNLPSAEGASALEQAPLAAKLDEYFARLSDFGFSGAVLVAKDGQVVLNKGYGYALRKEGVLNTSETVFPVGSITKQFTAAAILKLEMQGRLRTGDLLSKYVAHVPADKAAITLHHLLTHTAGFDEGYGEDYERISREEYIDRVMKAKLRSTPGKQYSYSNAGYSLLAAVVEIVTGQSWERYVHDQLFVPAGMLHTGCIIPERGNEVVAHGYVDAEDWGTFLDRFGPDGPYWNQRGNGGILSTVGDMYKWHLALEGTTVLSEEAKKKYYTPYVREGPKAETFYAYGWVIRKTSRGTTVIQHDGGNGIFSADFLRFIDDHVVTYVATNWSRMLSWETRPALGRIIFGGDYVEPPKVSQMSSNEIARFEGIYKLNSSDARLLVSVDKDHLTVVGDGQKAVALLDPEAAKKNEKFIALNARTLRILEQARDGNYQPLSEAFGSGEPREQVVARLDTARKREEEKFGAVKKVHVLGTIHGPEDSAITLVREEREGGTPYVQYRWDADGRLEGVSRSQLPPGFLFFGVSSGALVSFDLGSSAIVRIREVGERGNLVGRLALFGSSGEATALRVTPVE